MFGLWMEVTLILQVFVKNTVPEPNVGEFLVESFVTNINSSISRSLSTYKTKNSRVSKISAYSEAHRIVSRELEGYMSDMVSNASKRVRTYKYGDKVIESYIKPFYSSLDKQVKLHKLLGSHIKQIKASTAVFIPLNNNVVNAYLSVLTNFSDTSQVHNKTLSSIIEHPSILEVKE